MKRSFTLIVLIFFSSSHTGSIDSSTALVASRNEMPQPLGDDPAAITDLKSYYLGIIKHFKELLVEQKYDQFIQEVLAKQHFDHGINSIVSTSGNMQFILDFVQTMMQSPHRGLRSCWWLQFQEASERCDLEICQALWDIRHREESNSSNMWDLIAEAIKRDDLKYIRWAIETLKSAGQMSVLKVKKKCVCQVSFYSRALGRIDPNPIDCYTLTEIADVLVRRDIMIALLQHGADHTQAGEYPYEGSLCIHYCDYRKQDSFRSMMKPFFLLLPRIIGLMLNSCSDPQWEYTDSSKTIQKPSGFYYNHCMAAKALVESPGLASEYIVDATTGNNPLHCAVLAANSKLIRICLRANSRLLDSKNRFGETPLTLAYAKHLKASLNAIIGFCREVIGSSPAK